MSNDFGSALKELRTRAGMSLADLARATSYSKPLLGLVETGKREPTVALAEACDQALGAHPLLTWLVTGTEGDPLRRRALIEHVGVLSAAGAAGVGIAEVVRQGLLAVAGAPDWGEIVTDYGRKFVRAPSKEFGARLLFDLILLRQRIRDEGDTSPDLFRAAAGLGTFYGLWLGNQGDLPSAHRWYRSAATLADHSGDCDLGSYIRARETSRGLYEGWTIKQTERGIARVLDVVGDRPTIAALEAYCAEAQVGALTGNARRGRDAVAQMRRIAERVPHEVTVWQDAPPIERAVFLDAFVESRVGSLAEAERACAEAFELLRSRLMWIAEVHQYQARALVADRSVTDGIRYALEAASRVGHEVRVISFAVRDVVDTVPAGWESDDLEALRKYASGEPGPWVTLR